MLAALSSKTFLDAFSTFWEDNTKKFSKDSAQTIDLDLFFSITKVLVNKHKPTNIFSFIKSIIQFTEDRLSKTQPEPAACEAKHSVKDHEVSVPASIYTNQVGWDIGGTLSKVTCFEPFSYGKDRTGQRFRRSIDFLKKSLRYGSTGIRDERLSFVIPKVGTFHFLLFATHRMDGALKILRENNLVHAQTKTLVATGGGALKFANQFRETLDISIDRRDEMGCLVSGLNFLLQHVPDECYFLQDPLSPSPTKVPYIMNSADGATSNGRSDIFPYLLVNIGTGVSVVRVDSSTSFKRVNGSFVGGGTFLSLCKLLTKARTFSEAMALSALGDFKKVDMLVGDIYGEDGYRAINLQATATASALGKIASMPPPIKITTVAPKGNQETAPKNSSSSSKKQHNNETKRRSSTSPTSPTSPTIPPPSSPTSTTSTTSTSSSDSPPTSPKRVERKEKKCRRKKVKQVMNGWNDEKKALSYVSEADVAASVLHLIGGNIAQLAYLTAVNQNITHILFAGNFLRENLVSSKFLSVSIHYWSQGKMKALFLKHEGYFGSLGALLND